MVGVQVKVFFWKTTSVILVGSPYKSPETVVSVVESSVSIIIVVIVSVVTIVSIASTISSIVARISIVATVVVVAIESLGFCFSLGFRLGHRSGKSHNCHQGEESKAT